MIDGVSDSQAVKGEVVPPDELRDWQWAKRHYIPGKIPPALR
jgi:hypothetical protein